MDKVHTVSVRRLETEGRGEKLGAPFDVACNVQPLDAASSVDYGMTQGSGYYIQCDLGAIQENDQVTYNGKKMTIRGAKDYNFGSDMDHTEIIAEMESQQ